MNIRLSEIRSQKSEFCLLSSALCLLSSVFCLYFAGGCENANKKSLTEEIATLKLEKARLKSQTEQSQTKNEQLKKQLQVLTGLPPEVRLENLYRLRRIKITRYTNFYDKDKDGQYEKLIVYIQPIDHEGDIVKATGTVDVQLWDLNRQSGKALLGQWQVKPDELKELWFATLVTINYRLTFDVADKIEALGSAAGGLIVKVTFTDYLSGKVFKEQKVIKPR